jgi:hypothetical protein
MGRLIGWLHIWAAAAAVLAAVALVPATVDAAGSSRAGLIVAHGDGRMAYALVTFDGPSISGADLLDRSGLAVTEVTFGSLGVGVCAIDATGCDIGECRKRLCQGARQDDPFWRYFVETGEGAWQFAALGISGDTVSNGGVRALIWSAGAPDFPALSLDDLAAKAGAIGDGGVALTRYQADGSVDTGSHAKQDDGLPYAGLAVVGFAVVIDGGIYVRRKR